MTDDDVDRVFHALADATRRDILSRAAEGDLSVSRLADNYAMSVTAVQKHVVVLERAGLITKQRIGREQRVRTDREAVHRAHQALDHLEQSWLDRIDRMADVLAQPTVRATSPKRHTTTVIKGDQP